MLDRITTQLDVRYYLMSFNNKDDMQRRFSSYIVVFVWGKTTFVEERRHLSSTKDIFLRRNTSFRCLHGPWMLIMAEILNLPLILYTYPISSYPHRYGGLVSNWQLKNRNARLGINIASYGRTYCKRKTKNDPVRARFPFTVFLIFHNWDRWGKRKTNRFPHFARSEECRNRFVSRLSHFVLNAAIGKTEYGFVFRFQIENKFVSTNTELNEENKSTVYTRTHNSRQWVMSNVARLALKYEWFK